MKGEPLIRRVVTVTGAVNGPGNFMVRIGTGIQDVIDYAGGFAGEPLKIVSGGPMMGLPVPSLECVITKGSSAYWAGQNAYGKYRGGQLHKVRKVRGCLPIHLYPANISQAAAGEAFELAEELHALDCMSCGSCSYICPAKKPIAQNIKFAKEMIMVNRIKEKQKKEKEENC